MPAGVRRETPHPANRADGLSVGAGDGTIRVSIVIPAFDAERTVKRTLDLGRPQGGAELDIIVVDDASTDQTPAVIAQEAILDHRVRLLSMLACAGPVAARNRGLDAAWAGGLPCSTPTTATIPGALAACSTSRTAKADMVAGNVTFHYVDGTVPDAPMIPPALLSQPAECRFAGRAARQLRLLNQRASARLLWREKRLGV